MLLLIIALLSLGAAVFLVSEVITLPELERTAPFAAAGASIIPASSAAGTTSAASPLCRGIPLFIGLQTYAICPGFPP